MAASILLCFILAIVCLISIRANYQKIGWLLAIVPLLLFCWFLHEAKFIQAGNNLKSSFAWFPALNIHLSFYLDGLSLLFCLLITGMGSLVLIYSSGYMRKYRYLGRFYSYLFLFMGAMLGLILANNLLALFIFWELTSLASYLLISLDHHKKNARLAAEQSLLITVTGGAALLVAALLIAKVSGSYEFTNLLQNSAQLQNSVFYFPILIFIFIAAFTKSAQYPFHFWLPNAMQAPTPVSAYLHSATMVKAGIYLLMRFYPLLGHSSTWFITLSTIGSITMLCSSLMALRETDLKRMLAYSTIMALGTLVFLLASGEELTIIAALSFLIAHALYKGGLFLAIGKIDHIVGSRELKELGGLRIILPLTFMAVLLLAASMAGLPPMLGFIGKELIYEAKLASPVAAVLLVAISFITNVIFILLAAALFFKPFFGPVKFSASHIDTDNQAIKPYKIVSLWLAPLILGILGCLFGLFPKLIDKKFIAPAASSIFNKPIAVNLQFWHGLTPSFKLSVLTFAAAIILYSLYNPIASFLKKIKFIYRYGPENCYYFFQQRFIRFASWQTRILQNGYLRHYTSYTFIALLLVISCSFILSKKPYHIHLLPHAAWFDWLLCILIFFAASTTILINSYLTSLILLSFADFCITIIYLIYAAPDVAMTQISVGILTVIITVLALYRLPSLPKLERISTKTAIINAFIAIAVGSAITALLLTVTSTPFNNFISLYYAAHSYTAGHGRNIVNVILVDFRALDTLGEITVIATAGLGIYGLLKSRSFKESS